MAASSSASARSTSTNPSGPSTVASAFAETSGGASSEATAMHAVLSSSPSSCRVRSAEKASTSVRSSPP